jgi:hypothetical protein
VGVRQEFRKVALLTQEMAPDTTFSLFIIPGSLGAKDGGNVVLLIVFGYSDVTGITFWLLRQFQELARSGLGLLYLALIGGRSVAIQEGRTHNPGNGS